MQSTQVRRSEAEPPVGGVVLPFRRGELRHAPRPSPGWVERGPRLARVVPIRAHRRTKVTTVGFVTAAVLALGMVASSAAAWMWLVLAVLVSGHELGHYLAAHRFRYPVEEVVVGVGPALARYEHEDLTVELRMFPLLGWVEADTVDRGRYRHRRRFWFAAAGPIASAGLGFALLILGYVASFGGSALHPQVVFSTARTTAEIVVEVPATAIGSVIDAFPWRPSSAKPVDTVTDETSDEDGLTSIVGATSVMDGDVKEHGAPVVPLWAGVMSASIAGFNLIPAFGLDGHRMLEAIVDDIGVRRHRLGRVLRLLTVGVAIMVGTCVGILVLRLLLSDILGLV